MLRQREILRLLAEGHRVKQIAAELGALGPYRRDPQVRDHAPARDRQYGRSGEVRDPTGDGDALAGEAARGLGLRSAAERVAAVGGTLTLANAPGGGTSLHITIPLSETRDTDHRGRQAVS